MRSFTIAMATTASLMLGGVAIAQTSNDMQMNKNAPGASSDTSGPATGGNVTPSTNVQKNRSSSDDSKIAPAGGGAPGVEAHPGPQSGPTPDKGMK